MNRHQLFIVHGDSLLSIIIFGYKENGLIDATCLRL